MRTSAAIVDMMFFLVLFSIVNYLFVSGDFTESDDADEILIIELSTDNSGEIPRFNNFDNASAKFDLWLPEFEILRPMESVYKDAIYTQSSNYSRVSASINSVELKKIYISVSSIVPQVLSQKINLYLNLYVGAKHDLCELSGDNAFIFGHHSVVVIDFVDSKSSKCTRL